LPDNVYTRNFCEMHFNTSLDGNRIIRIPDPVDGIAAATVNSAAMRFVSANPFDETVGSLTSLARADHVVVTRTVLI